MASANPAKRAAEHQAAVARAALAALDLARPMIVGPPHRFDGIETYTASTTSPVYVRTHLAGTWCIRMYWRYQLAPGRDRESFLAESSISLNVSCPEMLADDDERCVVRYDYEGWGGARGSHLNVLQPAPLDDAVHWLLPGARDHEWPVGEALEFLTSENLYRELEGAGWQLPL